MNELVMYECRHCGAEQEGEGKDWYPKPCAKPGVGGVCPFERTDMEHPREYSIRFKGDRKELLDHLAKLSQESQLLVDNVRGLDQETLMLVASLNMSISTFGQDNPELSIDSESIVDFLKDKNIIKNPRRNTARKIRKLRKILTENGQEPDLFFCESKELTKKYMVGKNIKNKKVWRFSMSGFLLLMMSFQSVQAVQINLAKAIPVAIQCAALLSAPDRRDLFATILSYDKDTKCASAKMGSMLGLMLTRANEERVEYQEAIMADSLSDPDDSDEDDDSDD